MNIEEYEKKLTRHLRPTAAKWAAELMWPVKDLQLTIARARESKYGDYRPKSRSVPYHRISVNHDLDHDEFLVTLLHEFAHYLTHIQQPKGYKPHGPHWRSNFRGLLMKAMALEAFPKELHPKLVKHYFESETIARASALTPPKAAQANPSPTVAQLAQGTFFVLKGQVFEKGEKLRTYYHCLQYPHRRAYRVAGIAPINRILSSVEIEEIKQISNNLYG